MLVLCSENLQNKCILLKIFSKDVLLILNLELTERGGEDEIIFQA